MSIRPLLSLKTKRTGLFLGLVMLAVGSLFFVQTRKTLACPVTPVPLRQLYMGSQRVVVARVGQSALLQTEKMDEYGDDYERTLLRTSFYVSKTLKGEGSEEQVVHVYQWLWGKDHSLPENYAEGKTLLLFLVKREEGEGHEIADPTYGVKALSDDYLKVYVERIEELAKILRAKKPDKAEIVDWLVRCAEEPATRWEGAYELSASQEYLDREKAGASDEAEEGEKTNVAADSSDATADDSQTQAEESASTSTVKPDSESAELSPYSGEMARLLTDGQKKRLANAFYSLQALTDEDMMLLSLVRNWDDERLVPFLLAQLEKFREEPPYYVEQIVTALADKLQNEKLTAIAERYCENACYYDRAEAEASGDNGEEKKMDEEEKSLTGTSAQKRSVRLQKLLAEAQSVLNNQVTMGQGDLK
ncbi:MAG TPA: hypothetical protein VGC66_14975 [Pyrinomonadaceae bacterium]|jgi:hypothetical protein